MDLTPKFLGCGSTFAGPPRFPAEVSSPIFFSTPLQWECHFFTKVSRTAGTAPLFKASKLRLWLQCRAFWAQTGAVAAVWCPLFWAPTWPQGLRRLFGPNLGPSGGPFGASWEREGSERRRAKDKRQRAQDKLYNLIRVLNSR